MNFPMSQSKYTASAGTLRKICLVFPFVLYLSYLAGFFLAPPDPLRYSDSESLWFTAGTILEEGQFRERFDTGTVPTTWRPPLTALFLAACRSMGFGPNHVLIANLLLVALTVFFIFLICRGTGVSTAVSACVSALYLCHPLTYRLAGVVMAETLFMFLFGLGLLLCAPLRAYERFDHRGTLLRLFFVGVIVGGAILTRTVMVAMLPGFVVLCSVCSGGGFRWRRIEAPLLCVLVFLLGLSIPVGVWQARNARIHDDLVLINTAGSYNLFIGTVYNTTVLRDPEGVQWVNDLRKRLPESKVAEELRIRALAYFRSHPGYVIKNALAKAGRFWGLSVHWTVGIAQVLLLGVVLWSVVAWRKSAAVWALASMPLLLMCVHAVTFSSPRFFLPAFLPCLILLALLIQRRITETS